MELKGRVGIENNHKVSAVLQTCSEAHQKGLKHQDVCIKRCSMGASIHDIFGHSKDLHQCPNG